MSHTERDLFERSEPTALPVLAPSTCSLFRCIVADPPWEYPEGFTKQARTDGAWKDKEERYYLPYPSMTLDEIKALPVAEMADDDCRLWLWTTNRYLPDGNTRRSRRSSDGSLSKATRDSSAVAD
jgi:hypothetical protein